jgi:hypothetical protein
MDALLSTVQMADGILAARLKSERDASAEAVLARDRGLQASLKA